MIHLPGGRRACSRVECQRDRAVRVDRDGSQPVAEMHGGIDDRLPGLVVGLPVDREVPRLRVEAEQVHQVQRRLLRRLRAVLLVVRVVQERAERGAVATWDVVLDPVVDRHPVEEPAGVREVVVERRIARLLHLVLQDLMDGLEVLVRLVLGVHRAEHVVRVFAAVRLRAEQVDGAEAEALRELEDRLVIRVDQLTAELRLLAAPEVRRDGGGLRPVRVHPAAPARRRFVDVARDPLVLKGQRAGEAGDATSDDRDPRTRGGARRTCQCRRPCDRGGCADRSRALDELTPGIGLFPALSKPLDRHSQRVRVPTIAGQPLQHAHQRCTPH